MCKPDPELKGIRGGNCNRTACQQPNAIWYNKGSFAWYCRNCAITIQRSANDYGIQCQEPPMILFENIFEPTDPRHEIYRRNR